MGNRAFSASAGMAFILVAIGLTPWSWGIERLARSLGVQVEAMTGLRLAAGRKATLTLLPIPTVTMHRPQISDRGGRPLLQARVMRAELSIPSLLIGRIAPSNITIVDAEADASSPRSRHAWARAGSFTSRIVPGRDSLKLNVVNGGVKFATERNSVRSVALTLAWPKAGGVMDVTASGRWRDEAFSSRLGGLLPSVLTTSAKSSMSLALNLGGSSLAMQGSLEWGPEPAFHGHTLFTTPDIGALGIVLGAEPTVAALLREVRLEGEAILTPSRLSAADVSLKVGSNMLEGSLDLDLLAERPIITGTLAAETIRLPSPLSVLYLHPAINRDRQVVRLAFAHLNGLDFDLRLSASQVEIGDGRLQDVALSTSLKDKRLEATLGRASAYNGTLRGRATLLAGESSVEIRAQGSVERVELGALLPDLFDMRRLSGMGAGQIAIEASGSTVDELTRSLGGRVAITIKKGEMFGVDFSDAARRFERQLAGVLNAHEGRTPFDNGVVNLAIANGEAQIVEAWFAGPALHLSLGGRVSIANRRFQLAGAVTTGRNAATLSDGGWPFEITGLFNEPLITARPSYKPRASDVLPN